MIVFSGRPQHACSQPPQQLVCKFGWHQPLPCSSGAGCRSSRRPTCSSAPPELFTMDGDTARRRWNFHVTIGHWKQKILHEFREACCRSEAETVLKTVVDCLDRAATATKTCKKNAVEIEQMSKSEARGGVREDAGVSHAALESAGPVAHRRILPNVHRRGSLAWTVRKQWPPPVRASSMWRPTTSTTKRQILPLDGLGNTRLRHRGH